MIDLYQLHGPDPDVPFAETVGALAELRDAGKVRHVGLSNVSADQLAEARDIVPIASVQNRYNLTDRSSDPVLDACADAGLAFLPYVPLAGGRIENDTSGRHSSEHAMTVGRRPITECEGAWVSPVPTRAMTSSC